MKYPTLYIPHGGGPCFFMDWTSGPRDTWNAMGGWLRRVGGLVDAKPNAVVVISGHWEAAEITVNTAVQPTLFYDYYGFPPHTYELKYDAPGSPAVAGRVLELLRGQGIACDREAERGLDHGVFIPFKLIYPDADVPMVQVSLRAGLDPEFHLGVGAALAPLRDEGVLIVGSGMSYHNMQGLMGAPGAAQASVAFDTWLAESCELDPEARTERLRNWACAPAARAAHPREEHLLPLMVAAGAAAASPGQRVFADRVMGVAVSGFLFGEAG